MVEPQPLIELWKAEVVADGQTLQRRKDKQECKEEQNRTEKGMEVMFAMLLSIHYHDNHPLDYKRGLRRHHCGFRPLLPLTSHQVPYWRLRADERVSRRGVLGLVQLGPIRNVHIEQVDLTIGAMDGAGVVHQDVGVEAGGGARA